MTLEAARIRLAMNGERRLYEPDVLSPLLELLAANPLFAPETWSIDDRTFRPYEHDDVARLASGQPSAFMLQLKRGKRIKHTTMVRFDNSPGMIIEVVPKTPAKDWPQLFELSDALVASYQPELAWTHIASGFKPPFANSTAETNYLMDSGVTGISLVYNDYGPGGLGLRTYIGPRLIELFGRDLLLKTPAVVTELDWGGIRIDLVAQPWQASLDDLAAAWEGAMEHLRPANLFAKPRRGLEGHVSFERNERFTPGTRR